MKGRFVDNEGARPLVTIREDDPCWFGQAVIDPVPTGSIVRVYIPSDADPGHVEMALAEIRKRAQSVAVHRMPKVKMSVMKAEVPAAAQIRDVIKAQVLDTDLLPYIEESLTKAGL